MEHQENQQQQGLEMSQNVPDSLLSGVLNRLEQRQVYLRAGMPTQELLDAMHHPQWEIRAAALRALSEQGTQAPRDALLAALHDEHRLVRAAAVRALGRLGQRVPTEQLILALKDSAWEVREMAVLTLSDLDMHSSDPLKALLLAALRDSHGNVRDAAAYALNKYDAALSHATMDQLATHAGFSPASPARGDATPTASIAHPAFRSLLSERQFVVPAPQARSDRRKGGRSGPGASLLHSCARVATVFIRQIPLIHKSNWSVMPLLMLFWYTMVSIGRVDTHTASLYLALITTISAAAGTAFLYGGENDAGFELTLATPTSIRGIMFYRFLLVVGYTMLLSACASALMAFGHGGSLWEVVSLWLGPMLLISSFTLTLSMILGSWFALSVSLIVEITQSFILNMQDHRPTLELSLSSHWQTNPAMLCLALLLIGIAVFYAPRRPRFS